MKEFLKNSQRILKESSKNPYKNPWNAKKLKRILKESSKNPYKNDWKSKKYLKESWKSP